MRLSLLTFGSLQIALDDAPLTDFVSDKARAMLVYLALETTYPHRRESLAGLFWPESSERAARHTLSQTLSNVRELIGDRSPGNDCPFLEVNRQILRFHDDCNLWVDALQFNNHIGLTTSDVLPDLEARVALYRGHFMEGFSLRGCAAFDEWVLLQRERLQRQILDLLSDIVLRYSSLGQYERALSFVWRQLDLDSWREDVHRDAMRLLALTGQRNAALEQFEVCKQTLLENLGVPPEEETLVLYEAIKASAIGAQASVPLTSIRGDTPLEDTIPHNLPALLTPLIGREDDLANARALLCGGESRLLSLVGPGGVGKTHLATVLAHSVIAKFRDGVYFVPLAPLHDASGISTVISQTLDFAFDEKAGDQPAQLASYLRFKSMLLVFDNVEQLLVDDEGHVLTGLVTNILEAAPGVCIVVTSRQRLNMLGETIFPLRELSYPGEDDGLTVGHFDAVQLFVSSAQRVRPDFQLTEANAGYLGVICRLCGGLPLAILLAASWTSATSLADIATALAGSGATGVGLDMLEADWANVEARHQNIRAVFGHSWALLSDREQTLFQALSVFRGGFTLRAAGEIAGATPRDLRSLINASLLRREASGRYTLHPLVLEFAAEKLSLDATTAMAVHTKHSTVYCELLATLYADLRNANQLVTLEQLDAELSNLRAAWDWAIDHEGIPRLTQALPTLTLYMAMRGLFDLYGPLYRQAVDRLGALRILDEDAPDFDPEHFIFLADLVVRYSEWLGDRDEVLRVLDELLAALDRYDGDTRFVRAQALGVKAWCYGVGDEDHRRYAVESLALYEALGEEWHIVQALSLVRGNAWQAGDYPLAKQYGERALTMSRAQGDLWSMSRALMGLSAVAMYTGHFDDGLRLSVESLAIAEKFGNRRLSANGLYSLGNKYLMLGQYAEAHEAMQKSISLYRDVGVQEGMVFMVSAFVDIHLGNYAEAVAWLNQCLHLPLEMDALLCIGFGNYARAWAAIALKDYAVAIQSLHASTDTYTKINVLGEMGQTYAVMAIAHVFRGSRPDAISALAKALDYAIAHKNRVAMMMVVTAYSLLLLEGDKPLDAVAAYAVVADIATAKGSQWFQDVVGTRMAEAVADLDADVVDAARVDGKARGFPAVLAEIGNFVEGILIPS